MLIEDFEALANDAREGVRLEFINGKLGAKPLPDGDHDEIFQWLLEQVLAQLPGVRLYPEIGLLVDAYGGGRARTDAVVAARRAFAGQGRWKTPEAVLMVVEVTRFDSDSDRRDREEKPRAYAETGIPVYLLIDRESQELIVYSRPRGSVYSSCVRLPIGEPFELPDPVEITLNTEPLRDLVH